MQLTRERSRKKVNVFLERSDVDHRLGPIQGWRACFGVRYCGSLVGVCVVGRPTARMLDDDTYSEITRYASRPDRPDNMGTWLVARARQWTRLEGYNRLIAYAGVGGNRGTLYHGAGFSLKCPQCRELLPTAPRICPYCIEEYVPGDPIPFTWEIADGQGYTNREGRSSWPDYRRRTWVYELDGPTNWN